MTHRQLSRRCVHCGQSVNESVNELLSEVGWVGDWRGDAAAFRFQPPPVDPCMRFSRTRLTDVLHRRCLVGARQCRFGLGATTIPLREIRPRLFAER
jgi:hypothetical protein